MFSWVPRMLTADHYNSFDYHLFLFFYHIIRRYLAMWYPCTHYLCIWRLQWNIDDQSVINFVTQSILSTPVPSLWDNSTPLMTSRTSCSSDEILMKKVQILNKLINMLPPKLIITSVPEQQLLKILTPHIEPKRVIRNGLDVMYHRW